MVVLNNSGNREYKINEYAYFIFKNGKSELRVKNDFFNLAKNLLIDIPFNALECKINDFLSIQLKSLQIDIFIKKKRVVDFNYELIKALFIEPSNHRQGNLILHPVSKAKSFPPNNEEVDIFPAIMFYAECANLQEWSDSNYSCRLFPFGMAFTLLKELRKAGDPMAEKELKGEIAKTIEKGNPLEIFDLVSNCFLDRFNFEELHAKIEVLSAKGQSPLAKIALIENLYRLGVFRSENAFKTMIENECESFNIDDRKRLLEEILCNLELENSEKKGV